MGRSYIFTGDKIDEVVTKATVGNFALGYSQENIFVVKYVGRADLDINQALKSFLPKHYKRFKFSYAESTKIAFETECRHFHEFGGIEKLDNHLHPKPPENSGWTCAYCNALHQNQLRKTKKL